MALRILQKERINMKITSTSNIRIKNIISIQKKSDSFAFIEGKHIIEEAYAANILETVYTTDDSFSIGDTEIFDITDNVSNKISFNKSASGYYGIVKKQLLGNLEPKRILVLDGIQDPGNFGTILRSALAFNIDLIMTTPQTVSP